MLEGERLTYGELNERSNRLAHYLIAEGVGAEALVGLCIAPVLYIIIGGFRTNAEITVDPSGFPSTWQFVNYAEVLQSSTF